MFVATGIGPYSGQAVHFKHFAPDKATTMATTATSSRPSGTTACWTRIWPSAKYILGDTYTIVDMAAWGWARMMPVRDRRAGFCQVPERQALARRDFNARPAAVRAAALKDKHPFKTEWDNDAKRHMFRHMDIAKG